MKRKRGRGFTLIEIVIALTVFTIGSVAILSLFMLGFDAAMRSADLTKTGIYAQWKMEDIKRIGYPVTADLGSCPDPRFSYQVAVLDATAETPPGPPRLQRVTVTISWTSKGNNYNEDFITYISDFTP